MPISKNTKIVSHEVQTGNLNVMYIVQCTLYTVQ